VLNSIRVVFVSLNQEAMQVKKYPHAVLENYSTILVQLGLVLSLFIVYEFIQMKTYTRDVKEITSTLVRLDKNEQIIEFIPIEIEQKQVTQTVLPDKILKVDDEVEVEETIIESTETDQFDAVVVSPVKDIVAVEEEEEEVVEDVPFMIIENVPIFPGCVGNNKELRDCFSSEITKFVSKNFNSEIAQEIGLTPGTIQRIFVLFKIDKNGDIVDIQVRAPHKRLESEAVRVVQKLPKMTPGKQRGRAVGVKYALPIAFKIE
jgi:protein TonB